VHLAARAHQPPARDAVATEQAFVRDNVLATRHLFVAAARAGVKHFVLISSVKVHGESTTGRGPFVETDPPAPEDAYGRSKLAAEQTVRAIAAATGVAVTILRPPLLYGPGVKGNLRRLLEWIERGWPLPLAAAVNRRSLLANDALCGLIVRCLEHPAAAQDTFLAADGCDFSTPELIRILARGLGRPARLFAVPPAWLRVGARWLGHEAEARRLLDSLQIDASKARRLLDWQPPPDPAAGLYAMARASRHALGAGAENTRA